MLNKIMHKPFATLFVFVLLVNVVIGAKVYINRSSIMYQVTLTERELQIPYYNTNENSGLHLQLQYRVVNGSQINYTPINNTAWLNREKMLTLGFSEEVLNSAPEKQLKTRLGKEVFIVLEQDGNAYKQQLQNEQTDLQDMLANTTATEAEIKSSKERLERENRSRSRLFAIDAGSDLIDLQRKFAENTQVFIVKGVIKPLSSWLRAENEDAGGYIESLHIERINVPMPWSPVLKGFERTKYDTLTPPRYQVKLNYGKDLQPWVETVSLLD